VAKLDLKKELKELYSPSAKEVALVDVPEMSFLAIDGAGYPGTSQEYQDAMMALYGVAYTLKFSLKNDVGDFTVMPLEGLWWAGDMAAFAGEARKDEWKWTSMIALPDFVTQEHVDDAKGQLLAKRGEVPGLEKLRLERFAEGLSVQIMHIGPYAEEAPTIRRLHDFMDDKGYTFGGKHHEIYLSDPRRTKPERLKTVVRQPVRRK
jgi:hypothetical protein